MVPQGPKEKSINQIDREWKERSPEDLESLAQ